MEQILFLLVRIVLIGCSIVLTAFISKALSKLASKGQAYVSTNPKLWEVISEIETIVRYCVNETNQTFVNELKASGDWNEDRMAEAFSKTFGTAFGLVTNSALEFLEDEKVDIADLLTVMIETYILQSKKGIPTY